MLVKSLNLKTQSVTLPSFKVHEFIRSTLLKIQIKPGGHREVPAALPLALIQGSGYSLEGRAYE